MSWPPFDLADIVRRDGRWYAWPNESGAARGAMDRRLLLRVLAGVVPMPCGRCGRQLTVHDPVTGWGDVCAECVIGDAAGTGL